MHYYEDGNVRLITKKPVSISIPSSSSSGSEIMRAIASAERKYQEELNRAFGNLSEGAFKGLRRQLPVTRQRVEWEKIGGYRVSFLSCFVFIDLVLLGCGLVFVFEGWLRQADGCESCSWGRISVGGGDGEAVWGGFWWLSMGYGRLLFCQNINTSQMKWTMTT